MPTQPRVPSAYQLVEAVSRWEQRRQELLSDPDLIADEAVLALTESLESERIDELLSRLIDSAIWAELRATEADDLHKALRDRRDRYLARKETIRRSIAELFEATGRERHRGNIGSASMGEGPDSVVVLDADLIPDELCRITREPNKTAIRERIEAGRTVPGAVLSNAATVLRITGPRKSKAA